MLSYHTCPLATLGGKDTGGMNVYVRDLTRRLGRLGVQVDVYTRSQDEHVPHVLHDLGYGNRVVHVPAGPEVPLPKEQLAGLIPEFVKGICSFTEQKNLTYDVIHSHYWMSGVAAIELKKIWNVPIVNMFHTLGLMKRRVARAEHESEGDYRLNGERDVLEAAERIIAATPAELAQLQWLYDANTSKIRVIPPGVDLSRFYPILEDEAKEFIGVPLCNRMLVFAGRIEPLKGIDVLIEAIALTRRQGILTCLVVIGGDPDGNEDVRSEEMNRLQALRERFGLEDMVAFLGKHDQDTLPYYYSAADAVVMPSHYESFGMVALEAMACGTPVVASEVGGLAYLVQDGVTGFTVPADDPTALAEKLALIVQEEGLRDRMGAAAARFAQDYSWDKIARRIIAVYNDVIEEHKN